MPVRVRIHVEGVVQGVGFRPFAHALARRLGLAGWVANDASGVHAEIEGSRAAVDEFVTAVRNDAPPLAVVEAVHVRPLAPAGETTFRIVESTSAGGRHTLVSADVATCDDCLRELFDPGDRRFRYPFVNCTNCGPRFTIVRDVPYDRAMTTMAAFPLCDDCRREYEDPADRRFHAQPVCCPACGPTVRLIDAGGQSIPGDPIDETAELLRSGSIVAVKGLGGYHLAALASDENAVARLRRRKHREDKPFAVMAAGLDAVAGLAVVTPGEETLLRSPARPIVLMARRASAAIAPSVAPGTRELGVMLPYTPLHHLLLAAVGEPIVLTSGNVSDEPIAHLDDDAFQRLTPMADAFLTHDRPIHVRTDDSVTRVVRGTPASIRRSRGYAPAPIPIVRPCQQHVLAVGAMLKNTFCLAKDDHAFVSHHIGDLENAETMQAFTEGIEHFERLFDIHPKIVAHDLHPEYLSTKYALELDDVALVGVQHHHAHIASCLADNGESGPVIGVAFDGLGYGADATIWGGEFLVASVETYERVGHLATVPMPGGVAAIRNPWRMAAAYLQATGEDGTDLAVAERHREQWRAVQQLAASGLRSPLTSSAGRLFDAVAAVVGAGDAATYEGQAAIALEQLADATEHGSYRADVDSAMPFVVDTKGLFAAVVGDHRQGVAPAAIAARFHRGLAAAVVAACRRVATNTTLDTVALSGGVWQNQLLLTETLDGLHHAGLRVLTHRRVPANDGGMSLGQAVVAAARCAEALPTRPT